MIEMAPIDVGGLMDGLNDLSGPEIFNGLDKAAAAYAAANYASC